MIPSRTIARLATLGLTPEQADAVAEMMAEVEEATERKAAAAIEARRANDRKRKAEQRIWADLSHGKSRDITGTHGSGRDIADVQDKPDLAEKQNPSSFPQESIPHPPPMGGTSPFGEAKKPIRKSKAEAKRTIDPEWQLPDAGREYARNRRGLSESDISAEFERFRTRSLAKGIVMANWLRAWENWVMSPYCQPSVGNSLNGARAGPGAREGPRNPHFAALDRSGLFDH